MPLHVTDVDVLLLYHIVPWSLVKICMVALLLKDGVEERGLSSKGRVQIQTVNFIRIFLPCISVEDIPPGGILDMGEIRLPRLVSHWRPR